MAHYFVFMVFTHLTILFFVRQQSMALFENLIKSILSTYNSHSVYTEIISFKFYNNALFPSDKIFPGTIPPQSNWKRQILLSSFYHFDM